MSNRLDWFREDIESLSRVGGVTLPDDLHEQLLERPDTSPEGIAVNGVWPEQRIDGLRMASPFQYIGNVDLACALARRDMDTCGCPRRITAAECFCGPDALSHWDAWQLSQVGVGVRATGLICHVLEGGSDGDPDGMLVVDGEALRGQLYVTAESVRQNAVLIQLAANAVPTQYPVGRVTSAIVRGQLWSRNDHPLVFSDQGIRP
jgi:hypothetical protein